MKSQPWIVAALTDRACADGNAKGIITGRLIAPLRHRSPSVDRALPQREGTAPIIDLRRRFRSWEEHPDLLPPVA